MFCGGEVVSVEDRVEHGLRERVLHEHVGGLVLGDGGVQVLAERGQELHELVALRAWGGDDGLETLGVAGGDLRDLLRPERQVAARADLLDHLGVDLRPEVELVLGGGRRGRRPSRIAGAVAFADDIDDDLSALALVELDLVDFGVKVVVMRAKRVQDRPDDVVDVGIVERLFRRHLRRDDDGDDDVAVFLAGGAAHHASDGLDDVHLAVAGGKEQHGVDSCRRPRRPAMPVSAGASPRPWYRRHGPPRSRQALNALQERAIRSICRAGR